MAINRISCQGCHEADWDSAAHYGPELEVPRSLAQSSRKREQRRRCLLAQEAPETHCGLGDSVLAAQNPSSSLCEEGSPQLAALHDHSAYCIPEEAASLKNLVIRSKETVHCQSELLLRLEGALEASRKECQAFQEKAEKSEGELDSSCPSSRGDVSQLRSREPGTCAAARTEIGVSGRQLPAKSWAPVGLLCFSPEQAAA
ncbi:uncharacterized protein LOC125445174 isoform X3 [Sphaerodactylus townsendi]|uniref:uncharacterized protein LOC125445174 isoform X3 n=1 Tax=Sphaerodactylus townsendi TaxID=933632 RepID=UPI002025D0F2|nr:uncharacterized protein LOC125445174 isoform X3 [Sphaerodactylus townsendi]